MNEIFSVWYRVIDADGKLWIETTDPLEAIEHGVLAKQPAKYEKQVTRLVRDTWKAWHPIVEDDDVSAM